MAKKWFSSQKAMLHMIANHDNHTAVVFVHGILGDWRTSWTKRGHPSFPELVASDPELNQLDVYSFGYQSNARPRQDNLHDISLILQSEIDARLKEKKVIFIAHSMGGLIVRNCLINSLQKNDRKRVDQIIGAVYLAVPFLGSPLATPLIWNVQARRLKPYDMKIAELAKLWARYCYPHERNFTPDVQQYKPNHIFINGTRDAIVPRSSASPSIEDGEEFLVNEDHGSINKITAMDTVYMHTRDFLKTFAKDIENVFLIQVQGWQRMPPLNSKHHELDFTALFDIKSSPRKLPTHTEWQTCIVPKVQSLFRDWSAATECKTRRVRIYAKCCLSLGVLIGNQFSKPTGALIEVEQGPDLWKIKCEEPAGKGSVFLKQGQHLGNRKAVFILSVSADIEKEVLNYLIMTNQSLFESIYTITPINGTGPNSIKNEQDAVQYAQFVKQTAEAAKGEGIREFLLFINAPLGVAFFVGHYLTAVGPVQTFEYTGDKEIQYTLACSF